MSKKISIIIPTYNGEKYIKQTIESCFNQTYNNLQIIVIDDFSSDSTVECLKSFGSEINLKINPLNLGLVKTVNKAIMDIEGEFFIILGHDDILPEEHIEKMVSEFEKDTVAVHCNSILINSDGRKIKEARNDDIQIRKTKNCMFELSIDNFISSCGMVHKTSVFNKINGWDESYKNYGEWLYYIRELQYGNIKYTTKTNALYRKHETNITNTFRNSDVIMELNQYKKTCRRLANCNNQGGIKEVIKYTLNNFKIHMKNLI